MQQSYSQGYVDLWERHWWWKARHQVVLRELERAATLLPYFPRRILDIGCAGGVAFDDFQRWGDVYGIEPDPQLVDSKPRWRHRITHQYFTADFQPSECFDIVTMLDVLEHIRNDSDALRHLASIVRPGGFVILTVPALQQLWSVHDEINLHFRRYDRRELRQLLTEAGFEIVRLNYLFCWSLPLVYLRTWSRRAEYRVKVPQWPINSLFQNLTQLENWVSNTTGISLPCGSSLLAVVRRTQPIPGK